MTGAKLTEDAEKSAREILDHCERQRSYLAPNQRSLIDGRHDFVAATYVLKLASLVASLEQQLGQSREAEARRAGENRELLANLAERDEALRRYQEALNGLFSVFGEKFRESIETLVVNQAVDALRRGHDEYALPIVSSLLPLPDDMGGE
jgi:hypothetical protein